MMPMLAPLRWTDVVLRLGLTMLVGMAIGYNRREHGKAAGMRTTLLVCLAASVAMLQMNALLLTQGRPPLRFQLRPRPGRARLQPGHFRPALTPRTDTPQRPTTL